MENGNLTEKDLGIVEEKHYGKELFEKVRKETEGRLPSDYDVFILRYAIQYKTEEELKSAYDRAWKAQHNILITEEEFKAEAWNIETEKVEKAYKKLECLEQEGKINNREIYSYAKYRWCMKNPDSIIAYPIKEGWEVNNCETEITEAEARIEVCEEWGFEASRIRIIGKPYYEATDWQFIRFNANYIPWLWKNGSLYQVYE